MSFPKAALISVCALAAVVSGCAGGLGNSPMGSPPGGSAMCGPQIRWTNTDAETTAASR